ncbi:MAG: septation protein IspZ, partial [Gammaproteobacteria bacterium]|nr:septation protein IspZ [Gammaproteobacteria bacterium]
MNIFFDLVPLFLFFIAYKFLGIYSATTVAIAASILQVVYTRIKHKKFELIQVVTCVMILVFGGMTLIFREPLFIKWKPTMINWLMAIVFMASQLCYKKTLLQHMLKNKISAAEDIWKKLNYMWIGFFIIIGTANIIVAYNFD